MTVIDDYLKKVEPPQRAELERVRKIVKKLVPDANEVISYGIPCLKRGKKYIVWFAAFKDHMSLFPRPTTAAIKDKLEGYKISKGTIQFTLEKPLSETIIKEIVKLRLKAER